MTLHGVERRSRRDEARYIGLMSPSSNGSNKGCQNVFECNVEHDDGNVLAGETCVETHSEDNTLRGNIALHVSNSGAVAGVAMQPQLHARKLGLKRKLETARAILERSG